MTLCRPPRPALRPFVALIWASDGARPALPRARELVVPTGAMHLVLRLGATPLRLYAGSDDTDGTVVGSSIAGGVRAAPYLKDVSAPEPTVGIMLQPGAVEPLTGAPAAALAGTHTALDDIWPRADLAELRERLLVSPPGARRIAVTEAFLAARLPVVHGIHPLVAHAIARFDRGDSVGAVVADSGYSHRHVVRTFEQAIGLKPKTYARLRRFDRVLARHGAEPDASWADIAAAEDYADQAHLNREFRAFAGVTPGEYRRIAPVAPRHVPVC